MRLRDIRFKNVNAQILAISNLSQILIQWELEPTTQDLRNLKFFIDRGESPSDLKQLNAEGIAHDDLYQYLDESGKIIDLQKIYYYRVRAVEFKSNIAVQTFQTEPFTWDGDLDLVGIYVVEEHIFAHRYVYGLPTLIYKKKNEGATCPDCWDDVLHRVTSSNCKTCKGTGKLGGYYKPIDAWMGLEPDPNIVSIADWGLKQANQTDMQFVNYPLLKIGDLILEVKPHRWWRVVNCRFAEKNGTVMLQVARLDTVNRTDIEQTIDVPEDRRRALLKALDEREKEVEF